MKVSAASITVRFNSRCSLQIIKTFMPTSSYDDDEVKKLYKEIAKAINRRSHYHIVMEDSNTKIGKH